MMNTGWELLLEQEFSKKYYKNLMIFIKKERKNRIIYPPKKLVFNAFKLTPLNKVKVIILGQDPYHGNGQAHGLSFSIPQGMKIQPSLKNIIKELMVDENITTPFYGNLSNWAKQGVLLLNTTLTVRKSEAGSHQNKGWETFTDKVIQLLSEQKQDLVFMLWGKPAQQKINLINEKKHLILKAPHPSPLSAYRGFFGCAHFSKANQFLIKKSKTPIDWKIE